MSLHQRKQGIILRIVSAFTQTASHPLLYHREIFHGLKRSKRSGSANARVCLTAGFLKRSE
jgi:LAS superfamily LD-carboxypeptidase LdcB